MDFDLSVSVKEEKSSNTLESESGYSCGNWFDAAPSLESDWLGGQEADSMNDEYEEYIEIDGEIVKKTEWEQSSKMEKLICTICNFSTSDKPTFKTHLKDRHPVKTLCEEVPESSGNVQERSTSNQKKINWFQCDQCQYRARYSIALKNHVELTHVSKESPETCPTIDTSKSLQKRTNLPNFVKWFKCGQCSYRSMNSGKVQMHIKTLHGHWMQRKGKKVYQTKRNLRVINVVKCPRLPQIKVKNS